MLADATNNMKLELHESAQQKTTFLISQPDTQKNRCIKNRVNKTVLLSTQMVGKKISTILRSNVMH